MFTVYQILYNKYKYIIIDDNKGNYGKEIMDNMVK